MEKTVKILSLFLAAILTVTCLFGCGAKTSTDSQVQSQHTKFSEIEINENDNQVEDNEDNAADTVSSDYGSNSANGDFSKHTYQIGTKGMEVTIETDLSQYIYQDEIGGPLVFHALDLAEDLGCVSTGVAGWRRFYGSETAILSLHFGENDGVHVEEFDIDVITGVKGDYKRDMCSINIYSGEPDSYILDVNGISCTSDYAPLYCYILENANEWLNSTDAPAEEYFHSPFYNWLLNYYEHAYHGFIID